jgi:hypothetical protein
MIVGVVPRLRFSCAWLLFHSLALSHKIDLCLVMTLTGGGGCAGDYARRTVLGKDFVKIKGAGCGIGATAVLGLHTKLQKWVIAPSLGASPYYIAHNEATYSNTTGHKKRKRNLVFFPTASFKEDIDRAAVPLRPKCARRIADIVPTPSPAKDEIMREQNDRVRACTNVVLDTNGSAVVKPCLGQYTMLAQEWSTHNHRAVYKSVNLGSDCPDAGAELRTLFLRFDDSEGVNKWVISNSMVPSEDADSGVGCFMQHVDKYEYMQLGATDPTELTTGKWMYCDTEREMEEHPKEIGHAFDGQEGSVGLKLKIVCAPKEQQLTVEQSALFILPVLVPPPPVPSARNRAAASSGILQQCTVLSFAGVSHTDPKQRPYAGCMGYYVKVKDEGSDWDDQGEELGPNVPQAVFKLSDTGYRTCKGHTGMYAYYDAYLMPQPGWVVTPSLATSADIPIEPTLLALQHDIYQSKHPLKKWKKQKSSEKWPAASSEELPNILPLDSQRTWLSWGAPMPPSLGAGIAVHFPTAHFDCASAHCEEGVDCQRQWKKHRKQGLAIAAYMRKARKHLLVRVAAGKEGIVVTRGVGKGSNNAKARSAVRVKRMMHASGSGAGAGEGGGAGAEAGGATALSFQWKGGATDAVKPTGVRVGSAREKQVTKSRAKRKKVDMAAQLQSMIAKYSTKYANQHDDGG